MSGNYTVELGDRGRFVLPQALRERLQLARGSVLTLIEMDDGVIMATRDQLKRLVRADLAGKPSLAAELLEQRRTEAARER